MKITLEKQFQPVLISKIVETKPMKSAKIKKENHFM